MHVHFDYFCTLCSNSVTDCSEYKFGFYICIICMEMLLRTSNNYYAAITVMPHPPRVGHNREFEQGNYLYRGSLYICANVQ